MSRHSLRLRLTVAACLLVALALGLAGLGLVLIFDRILDRRTAEELQRTARFIAGQVRLDAERRPTLGAEPADPRFATPYGGLYWQVTASGGRELRSRSLWDSDLRVPPATTSPASGGFDLAGPDRQDLLAVARKVSIGRTGEETALDVVVAMDRRDLAGSRREYLRLIVPSLAALGLVLALAMWAFVARALSPFRALRAELLAVQSGRRAQLQGRFPDEVRPLVESVNRLLRMQEHALAQARSRSGDLAHGLKTPLAVLDAISRQVGADDPELSRAIGEQSRAMTTQVERSLARARAAAARRLSVPSSAVEPVVAKLVAALGRLPEAASLRWEVSVPADLAYPAEEGDLTELLGNLLDNARKWAHRRIRVTGEGGDDGRGRLLVEDDGPGMSEAAVARIDRGRRWDETVPGTGFGLAIAAEIADETGARLVLDRGELGGLRAEIAWPTAAWP